MRNHAIKRTAAALSPKELQKRLIWTQLRQLWTSPENQGSFSSKNAFYNAAKDIPGVTRQLVHEFLTSEPSYTKFAPRRRRFPRRKIISFTTDSIWQADLAVFDKLGHANGGNRYILVVVDTLSGYTWLEGVKRKTSYFVTEAFHAVLQRAQPRKPRMLFTDGGLEFHNSVFHALLAEYAIHLYRTKNQEIKASQAERRIRDLKRRLYRMLSAKSSKRYIDKLHDIEHALNNSYNRVIGMTALEASAPRNEKTVFRRRYESNQKHRKKRASFSQV